MSLDFFRLLTHEADSARIAAHHDAMRSLAHEAILETEFRVRTPAGQWLWLLIRDRPFKRDRTGRVTQILCVAEQLVDRRPTAVR